MKLLESEPDMLANNSSRLVERAPPLTGSSPPVCAGWRTGGALASRLANKSASASARD
jgi:hypothetical protein